MSNLFQKIFSVKNEKIHKVITLLGIKIKLKSKVLEERYENKKIKKYLKSLKTDIKNLKEEIDELIFYAHQENPTKDLDLQPRRNMRLHMCEIAADSSAKYIMENLLTAPAFKSRKELLSFALSNVKVSGLYMEFGVFNGNTINHIAKQTPDNTIYGFDSFEGLPETWQSLYTKGFFKVDKLPDVLPNVELVKGWFDESIPRFVQEKGDFKIAFLHSDSDLYSSTKTTFECLKNNLQSGTIIVFDEYLNYPGWEENEHKAFMEFISDTGFKYKYIGYVSSGKQMAIEIL